MQHICMALKKLAGNAKTNLVLVLVLPEFP